MPHPTMEQDPETGKFLNRKDMPIDAVMNQIERERGEKKTQKPEEGAGDKDADKDKDQQPPGRERHPEHEAEREEEEEAGEEGAKPGDKPDKDKGADTDKKGDGSGKGSFLEDFLEGPRSKKEQEKEKDKQADKGPEPKKKDDKKGKPAASAAPTPKVQPRTPAPLTDKDIATATAEAVANVLKPKEKADQGEATPELPANEQRKVKALERMEKLFPDNAAYKNIGDRYKRGLLAFEKYAEDWEKAHPGEQFDQEAEEHKAFLQKNNVDWQDEDFTEAVADLRADSKLEQRDAAINARLSKFERAEKLRAEEPKVVEQQNIVAKQIWTQFGEEFAEVITDGGQINGKKLQELSAADPTGFGYRWAAAVDLNREAAEVYKLYRGLIDYDDKNPIHVEMNGFIDNMEARLAAKPIEDKTDAEGRVFATQEQWNKLTDEQRKDRWTLTSSDVLYHRARFLVKETNEKIQREEERLRRHAEAKGWKVDEGKPNQSGKTKKPGAKEQEQEQEEDDEKPHGPGAVPASKMAAQRDRSAGDRAESGNSFLSDV